MPLAADERLFSKSIAPWAKAATRNWPCPTLSTTSAGCNAGVWRRRDTGGTNLRGFEQTTPIPSDRPFLREHAGDSGGMLVGDCYTRLDARDGARCANSRSSIN